jgi:UDP-N-acetylmuramoylalanine--D-glutamate ligase
MDNRNLNNIKNKRVLIVGLGKSGVAATQAMLKLGAEVTVQDSKSEEKLEGQLLNFLRGWGVKLCLGEDPKDLGNFDMVILSPGVNPEIELVQKAKAAGAEIVGELEIAYRVARSKFIAITGTNGKTTTTTLVGAIMRKSGRSTYVVGNIGVAVISKALEATEDEWLVTETSSFQLETTKYFKPVVSAILNVTPDHLNRHHTLENYGMAKAKIFENQDENGYCIINGDDERCLELVKNCKAKVVKFSSTRKLDAGAFVENDKLVIKEESGQLIELCKVDELKIIGNHNVENALAAAAICYYAGVTPEVITQSLKDFPGVAHRIEYCGQMDGISFYNDSKGTNVDAAITALKALKKNIILIAGGDGKGQDFLPFVESFNGSVKGMVLLGKDGPRIAEAADKVGFTSYVYGKNMDECVRKAVDMATEGDIVLLSPACASWDMYTDFEQRGNHFKEIVKRLIS